MPELAPLHPVNRRHLDELTDDVGILQHAIGPRPDPVHGYCTDDVARALQVDLLQLQELGWTAVAESAWRNLRFLTAAFNGSTGRFRNFRRVDGTWIEAIGSEDSHGRAILALGATVAGAPDTQMVDAAAVLLERAMPAGRELTALRAQASVLLGCEAALRASPSWTVSVACRVLGDQLRARLDSRLEAEWPWPESRLTYENALPVQALIVAGSTLASPRMIDTGLRLLDWLISAQIAPGGHFSPVGNGWWSFGGLRAQFDQQPIEATAVLIAADTAWRVTGAGRYRTAAERAYAWFLGDNDLGLDVAEPARGACHDGLTKDGVNANQGAESTLMWLTALEHIRALRNRNGGPASEPTEDDLVAAVS